MSDDAENAKLRQRVADLETTVKAAFSGALAAHKRIDELAAVIQQLRPRARRRAARVEIVE